MREIAVPLRAAPARERAVGGRPSPRRKASLEHLSERDQDRLDEINLLLDEQIRPYLQGDGGDLHVLGLEGDRLIVHYQGACGTLPELDLRNAAAASRILLRTIEPDIEVVAA